MTFSAYVAHPGRTHFPFLDPGSGLTAVARLTGLEPATPGVTGRYSNQLSYNRPLSVQRVLLNVWVYYGPAPISSSSVSRFSAVWWELF